MIRPKVSPTYGCLLLRFHQPIHGYRHLLATRGPIPRSANRLKTRLPYTLRGISTSNDEQTFV